MNSITTNNFKPKSAFSGIVPQTETKQIKKKGSSFYEYNSNVNTRTFEKSDNVTYVRLEGHLE